MTQSIENRQGKATVPKTIKRNIIKGDKCPYHTVNAMIGYAYCQECNSYIDVIEGLGVICKKRLADAKISFPADE